MRKGTARKGMIKKVKGDDRENFKGATKRTDFLTRNKKMMESVKARRVDNASKSPNKSLRRSERKPFNDSVLTPVAKNSMKMKSLLQKFRKNQV